VQGRQQRGQLGTIGALGWGEGYVQAVAQRVDYRVNFGAEATPAAAKRFKRGGTFFWPAAALCAFTVVESTNTQS
jgi:hypothetical protein